MIHIEMLQQFQAVANGDWLGLHKARETLVQQFAWAIPNQQALLAIRDCGPLIEMGAGTGYWASLLQELGTDILPYDKFPPRYENNPYRHTKEHTRILRGGCEKLAEHPHRALFLCWPPYATEMGAECLEAYTGNTLVYVGEGWGGCNGDDRFWEIIEESWSEDAYIDIPNFPGIHDGLSIYKRC